MTGVYWRDGFPGGGAINKLLPRGWRGHRDKLSVEIFELLFYKNPEFATTSPSL